MTNRERVLASLSHRQPDRIPYHINFTEPAREKMAAYYGDPAFESKIGNCLHVLNTEPPGAWREVRDGIWEDQFGVEWDRSIDRDIGNVCNIASRGTRSAASAFPDPDEPTRFADHAELIAETPRRVPRDRSRVQPLRAGVDPGRHGNIPHGDGRRPAVRPRPPGPHPRVQPAASSSGRARCPTDAMMFGDDWGQQRGLIMGPGLWREFIEPRIRACTRAVKAQGKRVFIHSCGKVDELFAELIDMRPGRLQPLPARGHRRVRGQAPLRRPPVLLRRDQHAEDPALRHAPRR